MIQIRHLKNEQYEHHEQRLLCHRPRRQQRALSTLRLAFLCLLSIYSGMLESHNVEAFAFRSQSATISTAPRTNAYLTKLHVANIPNNGVPVAERDSASNSSDGNENGDINEDHHQDAQIPHASQPDERKHRNVVKSAYQAPRRAVQLYRDYAKRLWSETNPSARRRIASNKVQTAIRGLQHTLQTDEYHEYRDDLTCCDARQDVLDSCDHLLSVMPSADQHELNKSQRSKQTIVIDQEIVHAKDDCEDGTVKHHHDDIPNLSHHASIAHPVPHSLDDAGLLPSKSADSTSTAFAAANAVVTDAQPHPPVKVHADTVAATTTTDIATKEISTATTMDPANISDSKKPAKKKSRSVMFGAIMGAIVACWVFSGNYIFTGLFTLMTTLGQLEYYRMVMNTGVYPARRISVIGACSMFLTALFAPNLHQICLPMFGLWAMIWFLTMRRQVTSIAEIATTFTGMFYLGYVPSFWVRTRVIGSAVTQPTTRLASFAEPVLSGMSTHLAPLLPNFLSNGRWAPFPITTGSKFIFWTWLCLAFSDVGAYFVGRKYGKTKLGEIAPAAGATSPNKSVEGVVGGCVASGLLGILGAWVQRWPYFVATGAIHGVLLALLGLIGDLTASMLKRDAGLKDFGDLIPEHGGILDRVDSFIWAAPYSWLVCAYIIPALRAVAAR